MECTVRSSLTTAERVTPPRPSLEIEVSSEDPTSPVGDIDDRRLLESSVAVSGVDHCDPGFRGSEVAAGQRKIHHSVFVEIATHEVRAVVAFKNGKNPRGRPEQDLLGMRRGRPIRDYRTVRPVGGSGIPSEGSETTMAPSFGPIRRVRTGS